MTRDEAIAALLRRLYGAVPPDDAEWTAFRLAIHAPPLTPPWPHEGCPPSYGRSREEAAAYRDDLNTRI